MSPVHDKLKLLVDQLTERQAEAVRQMVALLVADPHEANSSEYHYLSDKSLAADYDPTKDPILTGELSFSGPFDLGRQSEDILESELGLKKGRI